MTDLEDRLTEWMGPDFTNNGYCSAKYRLSDDTIRLGDFEVPARVEVLNWDNVWQQHPAVFIHYGRNVAHKHGGHFVIFTKKGCHSFPYTYAEMGLYEEARCLGLTQGCQYGVASFPKEGD